MESFSSIAFRETAKSGDEWERKFEALPEVERIHEENFLYLKSILQVSENRDSFLTSANYYMFTGRRGLWLYRREGLYLCVCWHPNSIGKLLVFVPSEDNFPLVAEFLENMPDPIDDIIVARVGDDRIQEILTASMSKTLTISKEQEQVLDWTYPVHILSTSRLLDLSGKDFMYIRNRLHQMDKVKVSVSAFDAVHHSRALEGLLHRWAKRNAATSLEYENLYEPYDRLFSWALNKQAGLSGVLVFVDDQLEAVGLWDISNTMHKTANLYVNLCNVTIKGLSEYLIVQCCEQLKSDNIEFINLGGSESKGLDHFKCKFRPEMSLDLSSILISMSSKTAQQPQARVELVR